MDLNMSSLNNYTAKADLKMCFFANLSRQDTAE